MLMLRRSLASVDKLELMPQTLVLVACAGFAPSLEQSEYADSMSSSYACQHVTGEVMVSVYVDEHDASNKAQGLLALWAA